jgi:hypothetical protein
MRIQAPESVHSENGPVQTTASRTSEQRQQTLMEDVVRRQSAVTDALRLEWLTIGWMSVEALAAVWSGIAAGSLTVTAFGLDSVVELASACVLIWRLTVELRHGQEFAETTEKRFRPAHPGPPKRPELPDISCAT